MNIIEAKKAAEKGKTVISHDKLEFTKKDFDEVLEWPTSVVFGEWKVKEEPLRGWVNLYPDKSFSFYFSKEKANAVAGSNRIRCVEMVEVVP